MAALKLLVENLVLIIVLAVFLEMLLPAGDLRRYVNLVVGLMIIVAVLQAVTGVLGHGLSVNLPFIDHGLPADMNGALKAGRRMARENETAALDGYEDALRRQITALASLNADLTVKGVRLTVTSNQASSSFGRLNGIALDVAPRPGTPSNRVGEDVDRLRQELGNFYGLKPAAVSVQLAKGGG